MRAMWFIAIGLLVIGGAMLALRNAPVAGDVPANKAAVDAELLSSAEEAVISPQVATAAAPGADLSQVSVLPNEHPETAEERYIRSRSRAVPQDTTPQIAAIARAQAEGSHPERVTALAVPVAFDSIAWESDQAYRTGYLAVAEPGRVWQTAPPATDGFALRASGARQLSAKQGDPVELTVTGRPGSPISFATFAGGIFRESEANAVTVLADAKGKAVVHYVAYAGTTDHCPILAASPTSIGQVTFDVYIQNGAP